MFQTDNHINDTDNALKQNHIEALKSISQLLSREISSLEKVHTNLGEDIKLGKRISLTEEIQRYESDLIRCALIRTMGKQSLAAKLLGVKRSTLNEKIKRYGISLFELQKASF